MVDGYIIWIGDKNGHRVSQELVMKLWSDITGKQLGSIQSIVKNYHIISQHVRNWPNLHDYKYKDESRFVIRDKLIAENMFPDSIIIFEGKEYFLCKYDPSEI